MFVQRDAERWQVLELLRARSLYQLHEADPTTWAIPRLPVRPQVARRHCSTTSTAAVGHIDSTAPVREGHGRL